MRQRGLCCMERALPPLRALSAVPAAPTGSTIFVKPGTDERLVLVRIGRFIFDHESPVTKEAARAQRETMLKFREGIKGKSDWEIARFIENYHAEYEVDKYRLLVRLKDRPEPHNPYAYACSRSQPVDMLMTAVSADGNTDYGDVTFFPIKGLPPRPAGEYAV